MSYRHTIHSILAVTLGIGVGCGAVTAVAGEPGAGAGGPFVALDKARAAAATSAQHAAQSDAQAAAAFGAATPPADPAAQPAAAAAQPADTAGAPAAGAAVASAGHAPTDGKYDPTAHRDPFRPPNLSTAVAETSPKTPLEGYEIGQLRLVGVISGASDTRAMVEDSAGLGYIVTAGTPIGTAGGIVRRIEPRRMLIEETSTNFYGEKQPREVVMELPQEDRSP
jgi:Tfp pilus assembly protein PilP